MVHNRTQKTKRRAINKRKQKTKRRTINRRNTQKYKNLKGGSRYFDVNFLKCYEKNLANVQQSLHNSGKHYIDKTKAELFITNQLSEVRRQAARDLIENTVYITMEETFQIVEQLIHRLYGMSEIQNSANIYIYSGNESKSFYFLSVVALYFIRKNSYKEPVFVKTLTNEMFDEIGNNPLIILDDAAYSASQLTNLLNKIYYDRVTVKKVNPPNIFITLLALNFFSKQLLEKIAPTKISRNLYIDEIDSPFKLVYLPERLYEPILLTIGIERFFYLNYFFSLYTEAQPYTSLYFDHKMADDVSTYKKPLLYGPIVPGNYTPDVVMEIFMDGFQTIIPDELFNNSKNNELLKELTNTFILEHPESKDMFEQIKKMHVKKTYDIGYLLIQKLREIDICDKNIQTIAFYPFIHGCYNSDKLLDNINDPEIINFDYVLFMMQDGSNFQEDLSEQDKKIISKINDIACPQNWYKKGELRMKCLFDDL